MDAQLRILRIVHAAMLLAAVIYIIVAESLRQQRHFESAPSTLYFALAAVAAVLAGSTFLVRQASIGRALEVLQTQPDNSPARSRWFQGYLIVLAMSEAVVLFGFVLRLLGAAVAQVVPFYLAGIILLVLFAPRKP